MLQGWNTSSSRVAFNGVNTSIVKVKVEFELSEFELSGVFKFE